MSNFARVQKNLFWSWKNNNFLHRPIKNGIWKVFCTQYSSKTTTVLHGYFLPLHYRDISVKVTLGVEKVWNGMDTGPTVECKVLRPTVKMTNHNIHIQVMVLATAYLFIK